MKGNCRWLAKALVVSSLSVMLSGCFSILLIKGSETHTTKKEWKTDTITGFSLAQDSEGNKGYVFVGKAFDYLLTEGADSVVNLLQDPNIDRHDLQVLKGTEFILNSGRKKFNGALTIQYHWRTPAAKQVAIGYGFTCTKQSCAWKLRNIKGTIHKKNKRQNYSQVLAFYQPFTVGFYEYKRSGMPEGLSQVLLPITVTLDIVTSPLQILAFSLITR